jgi:homospermidine synthase
MLKEGVVEPNQITIVDKLDVKHRFQSPIAQGVKFVVDELTRANFKEFLAKYLTKGDFLIDLAWNIEANAIMGWAHDNGVIYLNTSLEMWDPNSDPASRAPQDKTLYTRHMKLRQLTDTWGGTGPTSIVEHGANPGLVSSLVKKGLVDIATKALAENKAGGDVKAALESENYPALAKALSVKVIHISERDTQITDKPKKFNEFVNTWSVEGFYEEGMAPAEMGWGTHEKKLPPKAYAFETGPKNQIGMAQPGTRTWVRSWVPNMTITGMVIRHGEAFTISDYLTVWDGDKAIYRPTVHYSYCPTDAAIASVRELEHMNWQLSPNQRIMNDEIIHGEDRLGVLLMGHIYKSWWVGSLLNIEDARKLLPGQSATTLQVGSAVFAAVKWAMENPNRGYLVPDNLPWREIVATADKYWGGIVSVQSDFDPVSTRLDPFEGWNGIAYDDDDPWQFTNFLIQ